MASQQTTDKLRGLRAVARAAHDTLKALPALEGFDALSQPALRRYMAAIDALVGLQRQLEEDAESLTLRELRRASTSATRYP